MDIHWFPPSPGEVKVNVHGATLPALAANGNTTGLGAVIRRANGGMASSISGTIPNLSPVENQLAAIHIGMKRAYEETCKKVIVETDNLEAFGMLKFHHNGISTTARNIIQQIKILKKDKVWKCKIRYVYPRRNRVATYLALLGADLFGRLFLSFEPLGTAAELMDMDVGLGFHDPRYQEVQMNGDEMELFDQALDEGWGAPNGPGHVAQFMNSAGFHGMQVGVAQSEMEIHDLIYEDELAEEEEGDDPVVMMG